MGLQIRKSNCMLLIALACMLTISMGQLTKEVIFLTSISSLLTLSLLIELKEHVEDSRK